MENRYQEKTIEFQSECKKYPLDIERLGQLLEAGVDINSVSDDSAEPKSILAHLIEDYSFYFECDRGPKESDACDNKTCEGCNHNRAQYCGKALHELIRFFVEHGFDVPRFGAECLYELCYSSYDNWVLMSAELLIDHGANLNEKDNDGDTVLDWVAWQLGDWNTGEFRSGNLFCAFCEMVKAAMDGEDYHGIRDFDVCIGHKVTRIERIIDDATAALVEDDEQARFHEGVLIWCDDMPLYVDKNPEVYVCPIRVEKAQKRIDISDQYAPFIGAEIEDLYFADAKTALIRFRGIADALCFGYCDQGMYDKSYGYIYATREIDKNVLLSASIERFLFMDGKSYAREVTCYSEETVMLKTTAGTFVMYSEGEHYSQHEMKLYELSEDIINGQYRELRFESIHTERLLYEDNGTWRGVVFKTDAGYLSFETDTFNEMDIGLSVVLLEHLPSYDFDKSLIRMRFRYVTVG